MIGIFNTNLGGNIGIGTSFPTERLDILGNVRTSGKLSVFGGAKIEGKLALSQSATDGSIFIGLNAGLNDDGNNKNTFMGYGAGRDNTTGANNTFMGYQAGFLNMESNDNSFIGYNAGFLNITGFNNTFIGSKAGILNTVGSYNAFIGTSAGLKNTEGRDNTFIGYAAGLNNTIGAQNTFMGSNAGAKNTEGGINTFIGYAAGLNNIEGYDNTFMGSSAGQNNTEGNTNTFVGSRAGLNNNTGFANTFIGAFAGQNNTTGDNNTAIGYNVAALVGDEDSKNTFAYGSHGIMIGSHAGVLGNIATQKIGGYVNWGTASDGRMKKNIKEDVKGLDFILQLRPVTYQIDALKLDASLREGMDSQARAKGAELSAADQKEQKAAKKQYRGYLAEKSKIRYTGFIAQEVEKATEATDFKFSGLIRPIHKKDHYSLRYAEFVVPLVKAVQEQQTTIETLEEQAQVSNARIEKLEKALDILLAQTDPTHPKNNSTHVVLEGSQKNYLHQNRPNPFRGQTTIDYLITAAVQKAELSISTVDGKLLKVLPITNRGIGQVTIETRQMERGEYIYTLILDGEVFESKKMVLVR